MIQLSFTQSEIQVLRELVETCLEDIRVEIQATDNMGYKEMLRERKAILQKLMDALTENLNLPLAE